MKLVIFCMLSFAVAMIFSISADAKLYKWVDKKGVTHFSNSAPPASAGRDVETEKEVEGSPSQGVGSQNIDSVLDSYKRDALKQQKEDLENRRSHRRRGSRKKKHMAEYYEYRIKQEEADLEDRLAKLENVKRQSYRDSRRHKERIRQLEKSVNDIKIELERLREEYRQAKAQ